MRQRPSWSGWQAEEDLHAQGWPTPDASHRTAGRFGAGGPIRAYLMHTAPAVVASLRRELKDAPDIELVGVQTTIDRLEPSIVGSRATVLLMDGSLDVDTLTSTIALTRSVAKVIVLAPASDRFLLVACLSAGAVGFLTGVPGEADVGAAIRRAQEGWLALTADQIDVLAARYRTHPVDPRVTELCARLSNRERHVLQRLAAGVGIGGVAEELGVSAHTAQTHLKNAMRKLNVRSRLAAIVLAVQAGVIQDPITSSDALPLDPVNPRSSDGPADVP